MHRTHLRLLLPHALWVLIASLGNPTTGSAADPFYERLLREGTRAYDQGSYPVAVQSLRLACFGLLDEPVSLAAGLTYLALAQAEIDDQQAFSSTIDRILEVERRFQAYSQLDLGSGVRQALEAHLERWTPLELLEQEPVFREVARRKLESQIASLPPEELREELARLTAAEPKRLKWLLMLADLELSSGNYQAAFAAAETILRRDSRQPRALCVRGTAGATQPDGCAQALADLDSCGEEAGSEHLREVRLRCLVELQDWDNAESLLGEVAPEKIRKAPFKQLAREIKRGRQAAAAQLASAVTEPTTEPEPAEVTASGIDDDRAQATPVETPSATEDTDPARAKAHSDPVPIPRPVQAAIERSRNLLLNGTREQLRAEFVTMRQLADQHPSIVEAQYVTAEIAYRLSRWQAALSYFERGGEPDPSQPDRLFYLSVVRYETGNRAAARETLKRCLPVLEQTDFVRSYVTKILDTSGV
ncbi:MAG: tetratricopeptide repeat protein [bacterium]|nr:tetratricopeptide repeat protein [bacterium]